MRSNGERDGKVIRINISILNDLGKTMAVLFHELCHLVYGHVDCSAEFEADLTYYGGKLAMALLTNVKTTPKRLRKRVGSAPCPSIPIEYKDGAEEPERGGNADSAITPEPLPIRQQIEENDREIARLEREIALQTVNASRDGDVDSNAIILAVTVPQRDYTLYCWSDAYRELPTDSRIWCFKDSTGKNEAGWYFYRDDITVLNPIK
jgi:hypothetical protein